MDLDIVLVTYCNDTFMITRKQAVQYFTMIANTSKDDIIVHKCTRLIAKLNAGEDNVTDY